MTTGSKLAVVGDLAINGRVRITDSLFLEGGYFLMWITDLARAPDQLDFTDTPTSGTTLVNNSTAFLHGGNVGLEVRW